MTCEQNTIAARLLTAANLPTQARILYMHRYGGMYADLDMEALRDLGPILRQETGPVFAAMQARLPALCRWPTAGCKMIRTLDFVWWL